MAAPLQYFLPGQSHGQRSLAGYSPQGRTESGLTEHACANTELMSLDDFTPRFGAWDAFLYRLYLSYLYNRARLHIRCKAFLISLILWNNSPYRTPRIQYLPLVLKLTYINLYYLEENIKYIHTYGKTQTLQTVQRIDIKFDFTDASF